MHQTAPEPVPALQGDRNGVSLPRNAWYSPFSFEIAGRLVRHLPHPLTRAFAAGVGSLGYRFCPDRRGPLMSNLEQLNKQDASELCLTCFQNFLRMLHDFCDAAAGGIPSINNLIVAQRGFEFLNEARRRGRGTLLITGHLGALVMGGMVLTAEGVHGNV